VPRDTAVDELKRLPDRDAAVLVEIGGGSTARSAAPETPVGGVAVEPRRGDDDAAAGGRSARNGELAAVVSMVGGPKS
jgi:hypothetical protein